MLCRNVYACARNCTVPENHANPHWEWKFYTVDLIRPRGAEKRNDLPFVPPVDSEIALVNGN
jgi:hypothetical protein